MSVSSAPATLSRIGGRSLARGVVAGVIVTAAIVGVLLGGRVGGGGEAAAPRPAPAPAPMPIAHDGLRLQVPSGWERAAGTVPGFRRPLAVRNTGAGLRATVERLPATSAALVPAAFISALPSAPEDPEVIRLASGRQAWRYRVSQRDGAVTFLYAAPSTSGVATVACTGASLPRGCDALARAVTVPGSRALEPGTSAAFYSRLPATVSELDAARGQGTRALSGARRSAGQAAAADGLARAHKAAGAALAPLVGEGDSVPTVTVGALNATATAYASLASAARARSPKPYADAGRAVRGAEADLRGAMVKVAAAASAASRTGSAASAASSAGTTASSKPAPDQAASTKPAAPPKPAAPAKPAASPKPAAAKAPAAASPAPKASQGTDLTLVMLVLASVVAIVVAVRKSVGVSRAGAEQGRREPQA